MNYENVLTKLASFINQQTQETDILAKRLRAEEAEMEGMDLNARLAYLEELYRLKGKIELLEAQNAYLDSLVGGSS